ncbi:MAG: tRNA lysidine(34) synthetase TilS [Clostridiales bacterium]|nr:tRNA lysidine(34) synthetase TilS [Candidatus Equinaster intestinalis]
MFDNTKDVTVALSGGADSVCLLYCLLELKDKLGLNIKAAHLNHKLRGEESDRDENFVKSLCRKLGVELTVENADINKICEQTGDSTELAARKVRYEFLSRVSSGVVATAHNADDNIETVLLNLTRGTRLSGLCGIPPVRDNFVRPLIFCTRQEIEAYCKEHNIDFVTDSTNLTDDYTRNKLRHRVVPELKMLNNNIEQAISRTVRQLREDYDYLSLAAQNALESCKTENGLDTAALLSYHKSIATRVLKAFYEEKFEGELENSHIEALFTILLNGGAVILPKNVKAQIKNGVFSLQKNAENPSLYFKTNILKEKKDNVHNLLLKNAIDCDKIVGELKVRSRCTGDKMRPAGRGVTKTLKQLFTELKIPLEERENLPVVQDEKGVVWVYGIGADERVKIENQTENCLIFEVKKYL